MPFDVAFGLDEATRIGFVVAFGTLDGLSFDWARMTWVEES